MRVLFLMNGITHYFNLITNKINESREVEIFYIYPKKKSLAMGEGVFETVEGANFSLIGMEEKTEEQKGWLYYEGLEKVLTEVQPDIIMLGETHLEGLLFKESIKVLIDQFQIKLVLKSIPFRLKKYEEALADFKDQLQSNSKPAFESLPGFISKSLKVLKGDVLYKQMVLDKKALNQFKTALNIKRDLYNSVDAHVNYIEAAYDIYGSYGVPKEKIFITYNSPDTDTYFAVKEKIKNLPPILAPNPYRIIHLSRLVEWKRVDMLVTAVAHLKKDFPKIELLVIGEGPEKEKLMKQAKALGVLDSIQFLGGVYDPELFGRYIMSSFMYVLAGMGGLSINDAMIFGLPVICSVCDGTEKHLVKEGYNGLYFKEGDQDSLEEKIGFLFNNPDLSTEMGRNSTQIIQDEINIHTVVGRYLEAFHAVHPGNPVTNNSKTLVVDK